MAKEETVPEDEKNSNGLAGLCYIPILLINIFTILYVVLAKKGGSFARFHAFQAFFLFLGICILSIIIQIPLMFLFFKEFAAFQTSIIPAGNVAETQGRFMDMWLRMLFLTLPGMIIYVLYFVGSIILAIMAFQGKAVRLPILAKLADKSI